MVDLIEFPADDLERARRFWQGLLGTKLEGRRAGEGSGVQTHSGGTELGVHERGPGPGDRVSLPYFRVADLAAALELVVELGGEVDSSGQAVGNLPRLGREPIRPRPRRHQRPPPVFDGGHAGVAPTPRSRAHPDATKWPVACVSWRDCCESRANERSVTPHYPPRAQRSKRLA